MKVSIDIRLSSILGFNWRKAFRQRFGVAVKEELISGSFQIPTRILAPVQVGEKLGKAKTRGSKILKEVYLLAERDVPKTGLLKRIWHSFFLFSFCYLLVTNQT